MALKIGLNFAIFVRFAMSHAGWRARPQWPLTCVRLVPVETSLEGESFAVVAATPSFVG